MAGSTMEVSEAVGEEIDKSCMQVDVLLTNEIQELQADDGVVVGGPMIMGWHCEALGGISADSTSGIRHGGGY